MTGAVVNIVIGFALAAAGATGRMALLGTQSSGALVVAGLGVAGFGVFQLWRARDR